MIYSIKTSFLAAVLVWITLLTGCASSSTGSYVVLLRDPDGKLGNVVVKNLQGEQVLSQAFKAATLDGSKESYFVTEAQLQRDFGAALAAQPPLPDLNQPKLSFLSGTQLIPQSQKDLQDIAQNIMRLVRQGRPLDISIIGHADTSPPLPGDTNEALAKRRAEEVRIQLTNLLRQNGLGDLPPIITTSDGDHNPLDKANPASPVNRFVEVQIR